MQLTEVECHAIYAIGYDTDTERLVVISKLGRIHHYFGVPPEIYEQLMGAESKSHYLQEAVISGYPHAYIRRRGRKRHR